MTAALRKHDSLALRQTQEDGLQKALQQGGMGDFTARSPIAGCLLPLLSIIGWRGSERQVAEALPHFADSLTINGLRDVLANLGYRTFSRELRRGQLARLDPRVLPCILTQSDGQAFVLSRLNGDMVTGIDGATGAEISLETGTVSGTLYLLGDLDRSEEAERQATENWAGALVHRFRGTIARLLGLSLLLNLFALAVPIFIMTLYDQVIPSQSAAPLLPLGIGIGLVFIFEIMVRYLRARMIAFMAGRMEHIIATGVIQRILSLPTSLTETAPLGQQVARIREFDNLRDIFTGTLTTILLEAPFALLFIGVIAVLGGWLALVPAAMVLLFGLLALLVGPRMRRAVKRSSAARAQRHSFLVEMISHLRTIKEAGAEAIWKARYRDVSAQCALSNYDLSVVSFMFQSTAQAIMMLAGAATIGFGVLLVLSGTMSIGGLIASMALVWRVLSPLHNFFLTLTKAEQLKAAVGQLNQLMRLKPEEGARRGNAPRMARQWKGRIGLNRVSFRYGPLSEPALLGVNLVAEPGEMLAIMGTNGSGKSTILKMCLGLFRPQAGQVTIDGMDIRQVDPSELRRAISYVPQQISMFHGTIAQNLRLADPTASTDQLMAACDQAGIAGEIDALPQGLATRFGDQSFWQLNAGFRQRLALARAYVRKSPIILMDEPAQALDEAGDAALMKALKELRGTATILMVTHRPSHVRLADRALVLDGGTIVMQGPPDAVYEKLPGGSL